MSNDEYGIKPTANPGRQLHKEFNGKTYARLPIVTPLVKFGDNFEEFLTKYAKPHLKKDDILCISAKVVSIANNFVVHESKVKVTPLARFIVKFVTKWPEDIGYSHPRKMQVAIDEAGYPRIILAIVLGGILKLFGLKGYFYRIAGNNINAIDGFNPVSKPPMNEYAVLPPKNGNALCSKYEKLLGVKVVILDGNNIDNNVLGIGQNASEAYSVEELMQIAEGNPQGQEDDGVRSPLLIIRPE